MAFYDLKSYKAPPPNSINQGNQSHLVLKGGENFLASQWCQTSCCHVLKVSIVCSLTLNYLPPREIHLAILADSFESLMLIQDLVRSKEAEDPRVSVLCDVVSQSDSEFIKEVSCLSLTHQAHRGEQTQKSTIECLF